MKLVLSGGRRNRNAALAPLILLSACASQPLATARVSAPNPAMACAPFPMTQYMWGEAYGKMLDAAVDPEWAYPLYVGLSTVGWVAATPLLPVADLLVAPARIGQTCT